MADHAVPATPQNFEVWFKFALGTSPELSKIINILIDSKRGFDSATNRSLFQTYVGGDPDREAGHVDVLAAAAGPAVDRARLPRGLGGRQPQPCRGPRRRRGADRAECRPATDHPATGRRAVEGRARATTLEANFTASLQELDKIRSHLATAEERSRTDALTGLANRHALDDFLRAAQMRAMENGRPLSILLIDIDHFKAFNDQFGHQFGDQVLRLIAKLLKDGLRGDDLAARFGGEELVGVLPGADVKVARAVAERIRQAIAHRQVTRRSTGEVLTGVTASIGVAQFAPGETLASLFERCDRALYAAKHAGRNRTVSELELDPDSAAA